MTDAPEQALDLGSGGGVPGLILALHWQISSWVLLDAGTRRSTVLAQAVGSLGIEDRVRVVCGRAEELARDPAFRGRFDLVTARSFGPPPVTAECGAPFLRVGGVLAVTEPPGPEPPGTALRWPPDGLAMLGLAPGQASESPRVQQLVATEPCPDRYPRRTGVPAKRPLF